MYSNSDGRATETRSEHRNFLRAREPAQCIVSGHQNRALVAAFLQRDGQIANYIANATDLAAGHRSVLCCEK